MLSRRCACSRRSGSSEWLGCNGILFNQGSPRRGKTFVSRTITRGLANIALGIDPRLYMVNLDALPNWGHTRDFARAQWLMLQQDRPEEFVIATRAQHTVRDFIRKAAARLSIVLEFSVHGIEELGTVTKADPAIAPALRPGSVVVRIDPRYSTEVDSLLGDASKARQQLGWMPEISLDEMNDEIVATDLDEARQHTLLKCTGSR